MQRDIKFRAWNKLKKIMVYEDEDNSSNYLDGWCASDVQVLNQTLNSKFVKDIYKFMQYTGLKDKNGKEIYEGDILSNGYEKCVVIWIKEQSGFMLKILDEEYKNEEWTNPMLYLSKDDEVIGNIYDNPELLEEK